MRKKLLILFLITTFSLLASISYDVQFEGIENQNILKMLKSSSQIVLLRTRPPASFNALKYRAESDIPDLTKVMRACGYYEACVETKVEKIGKEEARVRILIRPGPIYKIGAFEVLFDNKVDLDIQKIGIREGDIALAITITNAELKLLDLLSQAGYPLASIDERKIIVDGSSKRLFVTFKVKTNILASFGKTQISGLDKVKEQFVSKKIKWHEGEKYDSRLVDKANQALMESGLFGSVTITHENTASKDSELPMKIEVVESKHKNLNFGISYQTVFGPGITFGWENRNVSGIGRKLYLQGEITKKSFSGVLGYNIPDFRNTRQSLIWQGLASRESITAYSDKSYSVLGRLEKMITRKFSSSFGLTLERLLVKDSVQNTKSVLLEAPCYGRWSSANNLLNPTKGATLEVKVIPTLNPESSNTNYITGQASVSWYRPVSKKQSLIIAQRLSLGATLSDSTSSIPVPKRFFGGSEDDLRGYKYRTVSPLDLEDNKPIGGRSAIFYSLEARVRVANSIGLVPFFDIGTVTDSMFPDPTEKWFKSVGIGFRYFTFFGPLRFDLGFPLDRRKGIDSKYKLLVNIGQAF